MTTTAALPSCRHCQHYYITHDARFPYGCRAMQIQSRRTPMLEVRDATGRNCLLFTPRPRRSR